MSDPVEERDDALVQRVEQRLAEEEAKLTEENRKLRAPVGFTPSGQWVFRHMVVGAFSAVLLIAGTVLTYWFVNTPGFREGSGQGWAEERGAVDMQKARTH